MNRRRDPRKPGILIIDDEPEIGRLFSKILSDDGYRVYAVLSGEQGIIKIREKRPDLVFLDLKLPGKDGIEVLREIRRIDRELQVVILTGYETVKTAVEAMRLGAYDYLSKPLDIRKIKLTIKNALYTQSMIKSAVSLRKAPDFTYFDRIVGRKSQIKAVKILIADDYTIVRKGLCSIFENEPDIDVVGEAENGKEAIKKVEESNPDIVVMDITMPVLNGLDATRQIKRRFPEVKVMILTMHTNEEYVLEILKAGASGYIVKKAAPEELISAIRAISRGEVYLSPSVSKTVVKKFLHLIEANEKKEESSALTEREREILQLIAEGYSNRKIADLLFISIKTVEAHRSHVLEKLDIHNVADLTRYAIRTGIISSER